MWTLAGKLPLEAAKPSARRTSEGGAKPMKPMKSFQTWAIPSGGYVVRKMDVTPDGNPVLATSTINGVALVEVGK
jgi:virginiamycin B lyase